MVRVSYGHAWLGSRPERSANLVLGCYNRPRSTRIRWGRLKRCRRTVVERSTGCPITHNDELEET